MHGCGNDYVYISGFTEKIAQEDKPELVKKFSDRHFGIGGDGVIFINPDPTGQADCEMEMYNADGTRAEMCGNGIRCVAKFAFDAGIVDRTQIRIISAGKVKTVTLSLRENSVESVRVDMGEPVFDCDRIPVVAEGAFAIDEPIEADGREWKMNCVSMGNPHAVVFVDDTRGMDLEKIGPLFEKHPRFPRRVNTEFAQVIDRNTVLMRVWERGTGETLACGTGCCATAAACVKNGLTDRRVTVKVLGGELLIEWDEKTNHIFMTGPAETVFTGTIEY